MRGEDVLMPSVMDLTRQWQLRPTLRLPGVVVSEPVDWPLLERVAERLRQHPGVAFANVGLVVGTHSVGLTATILFAQPSTPGTGAEEAIRLLAQAGAAEGLIADVVVEVVAEPGGVDPRTLL